MVMNKEDITYVLNRLYPEPKCEINYNKDYELLLSVMLSAQTTDKGVNIATKELYEKYDTLDKLDKLSIDEINLCLNASPIKEIAEKFEADEWLKS